MPHLLRLPLVALLLLAAGCPRYVFIDDDDSAWADDDDDDDDDDDAAPECTSHTQCDPDEFCRNEECELVFGRSFRLTVVDGEVEPYDSTGDNWDTLSAPDPVVVVELDGEVVFETSVLSDTLDPVWNEFDDLVLSQTSLCVAVHDFDDGLKGAPDFIDGSCWSDLAIVGLVRNGGYAGSLYEGFSTITFELGPNF